MNEDNTGTPIPPESELDATVLGTASVVTGDSGGGGGDRDNIVWGLI